VKRKKLEKRLVVGYACGSPCEFAAVDIALDSSLRTGQVAALLGPDWRIDIDRIPQDVPVHSNEFAVWRSIASLLDYREPGPNLKILSETTTDFKVVHSAIKRANARRKPSRRWKAYAPKQAGVMIYGCDCGEDFYNWPALRRHGKARHGRKLPVDPRT
jgi:hypothetical protein